IEVMYHWTHDGHNPFSDQDIKKSRLPLDVKNWIEKHVEEKKDWREMRDLLQLSNEEMNELCITGVLKCERSNNISRKYLLDKQSTQAWIDIFKEKGYDTLFEIINSSAADEKADDPRKNYQWLRGRSVAEKGMNLLSCCFFIMNSESSFTISRWLSWLKFGCGFYPQRIMINCSVTEMYAILSTFGTEVQVLVCHWHIRRA
ncbi:hypothetical protein BDC45DRAFT_431092, partial [Circinella umbellata]